MMTLLIHVYESVPSLLQCDVQRWRKPLRVEALVAVGRIAGPARPAAATESTESNFERNMPSPMSTRTRTYSNHLYQALSCTRPQEIQQPQLTH